VDISAEGISFVLFFVTAVASLTGLCVAAAFVINEFVHWRRNRR
jgi:hypothetical protein